MASFIVSSTIYSASDFLSNAGDIIVNRRQRNLCLYRVSGLVRGAKSKCSVSGCPMVISTMEKRKAGDRIWELGSVSSSVE